MPPIDKREFSLRTFFTDKVQRVEALAKDGADKLGIDGDRLELASKRLDALVDAATAESKGLEAKLKGWLSAGWEKVSAIGKRFMYGELKDQLSREVLDDPSTRSASAAERKAAEVYLAANAAKEQAALAALGSRATDYQRLAVACGTDLMARHALMKMLIDGRLTGDKALSGGEDLLAQLTRVAKGPLAPGVDKDELLTTLLEETENPVKIAQVGKGTCVVTTATIVLARQNPAEYARLVADLAAPEGRTALQNGARLSRSEDWNSEDDSRTLSIKLLQPALMEYGNFVTRYDNVKDEHYVPTLIPGLPKRVGMGSGISPWGSDRVLEGLTGQSFDNMAFITRFNKESAWRKIEASLAEGKSVPAALFWRNQGSSGHQILIDKVEGEHVYYTNPWGQTERMPLDEFKQHLKSAQLPA